jgi:hypothetical protein
LDIKHNFSALFFIIISFIVSPFFRCLNIPDGWQRKKLICIYWVYILCSFAYLEHRHNMLL